MRVRLPPIEVTVRGRASLVIDENRKAVTLVSRLWCGVSQTGIPKLSLRQEIPLAEDLATYILSDDRLLQRWTADLGHMLTGRLMEDTLASHALQGVGIALQLLPPLPKRGRPKKDSKAKLIAQVRAALLKLDAESHFRRNNLKPGQKQLAGKLMPERDIDEAASYLRRRMREYGIKDHDELLRQCGYGFSVRRSPKESNN